MNIYKTLKIYSVTAVIVSLLGIALRIVSLFYFYDRDIGYYKAEAFLPDAFHILTCAMLAFAFSVIILLPSVRKKEYKTMCHSALSARCGAVFPICGIAVYILYAAFSFMGNTRAYMYGEMGAGTYIELFSLLFGFLGIIYFSLFAAGKVGRGENHVYFGYAVILFFLMVLAKSYFDFFTTMNSPNKLLLQLTLMAVMVYMLYEIRFSIGRAAPRLYSAVSLISIYLTAVCAIPGIAAYFCGVFTKREYLFCHFLSRLQCAFISPHALYRL
ncbi:MAG: hypothetical protein U0M06_09255 [Clostridia bacterium]|nr:hypothetical protein [Clostridia bacterium]